MYDSFFFIIVSFANSCSFLSLLRAHLIEAKRNETEKKSPKKNRRRKNLKGKY
jgi:hypothetical protein